MTSSVAREVTLTAGGRRLAGTLYLPAGAPPARGVVFLHGLGSDRQGYRPRARAVAELLGTAALAFDLGGHGESEGDRDDLSARDHLAEAVAAHDLLTATLGGPGAGDAAPAVGVCGTSYGGYLGALLPGLRPVRRLFLRAPALYDDALFARPGRDRRTSPLGEHERLTAAARAFAGDVMILESEHDEVVTHDVVEIYLRAFPEARHNVLLGAGHELRQEEHREAFLRAVLTWFGSG
jgi:pimeloyl-ACP methyl ester carboxylesterase